MKLLKDAAGDRRKMAWLETILFRKKKKWIPAYPIYIKLHIPDKKSDEVSHLVVCTSAGQAPAVILHVRYINKLIV